VSTKSAGANRYQPQQNTLLGALPAEVLARLITELELVPLKLGQVLAESGETMSHAYFPLDCIIALDVTMEDGGTTKTATVGREGMDGYVVALGDHHALLRSIVRLGGEAARLPVAELEAAFVANAGVRDLVLRFIQALLAQVMQGVACNALHAAEARLCRWLLLLADRVGDGGLHLTQEFLAETLGVQRTTVTLIARTLQTAGLIRYRRGLVEVIDRPGLEEAACECYRAIREHYERVLPGAFA
jgi:CRP-like cAMP-binding protein